jgi:hypothetical protein
MKITRNLLLCLAGGLLLNAAAHADDAALPGNPYAPMVARNIFGLNPPVIVDPNAAADATPPPKITPNGIMSIFGQLQVLFKVANPAKDGKPAADADYILSEGQSQDDIEVVKIDEKAGLVTFNNHGETQNLPLVAGTASSTAPGAGGGPGVAAPGFRPPPGLLHPGGNAFNNGGGASAGNFGGYNRGNGNNGMNGGGNNTGGLGNGLNFGGNNGPGSDNGGHASLRNPLADQTSPLSSEEQSAALEVNRELTKQQVINGVLPALPITDLTPSDAVGFGGVPVIHSSPNGTPP